MRTTIDIPDELYQWLKIKATTQRKSIKDLLSEILKREQMQSNTTPQRAFVEFEPLIKTNGREITYIPTLSDLDEIEMNEFLGKFGKSIEKGDPRAKSA